MRMIVNIGGGGHLTYPCYNCLISRKMRTNPEHHTKEATNHLSFYDLTDCQSMSPRKVDSYSIFSKLNKPENLPEPLRPIIGDSEFENHFVAGSLHTLLGIFHDHYSNFIYCKFRLEYVV